MLVPVLLLVASGLVMVASSSIAIAEGQGVSSYHYLVRHMIYVIMGLMLASAFRVIPIAFLERIMRSGKFAMAGGQVRGHTVERVDQETHFIV